MSHLHLRQGAPDSLKLVENKAYWYYQTGTVVFEDEKVIETSQGRVEPQAPAPAPQG